MLHNLWLSFFTSMSPWSTRIRSLHNATLLNATRLLNIWRDGKALWEVVAAAVAVAAAAEGLRRIRSSNTSWQACSTEGYKRMTTGVRTNQSGEVLMYNFFGNAPLWNIKIHEVVASPLRHVNHWYPRVSTRSGAQKRRALMYALRQSKLNSILLIRARAKFRPKFRYPRGCIPSS